MKILIKLFLILILLQNFCKLQKVAGSWHNQVTICCGCYNLLNKLLTYKLKLIDRHNNPDSIDLGHVHPNLCMYTHINNMICLHVSLISGDVWSTSSLKHLILLRSYSTAPL